MATHPGQALFLPEAADFIGGSLPESIGLTRPAATSPFVGGLQQAARECGLFIHVGIHEPTEPASPRIRNTVVWIDPHGRIVHRYRKLHMFDIDLAVEGGPVLTESAVSEPGIAVEAPFSLPVSATGATSADGEHADAAWRLGSLICFDVRFPEPALALRRLGANILLYPSAFTVPTGQRHWEVLLRARAIETQCFVIASAQRGRHHPDGARVAYGDSLVVGPDGDVRGRLSRVAGAAAAEPYDAAREPELLLVDLDVADVARVRRNLPLRRRTDVYAEV